MHVGLVERDERVLRGGIRRASSKQAVFLQAVTGSWGNSFLCWSPAGVSRLGLLFSVATVAEEATLAWP